MQKYIERSRAAAAMDALGMRLMVLAVCIGWFLFLWGLSLPAILAGFALTVLCLLCIRLFNKRTLTRREAALRRAIGGELALERLLVRKDAHAQFQAAMWLEPKYPVKLIRMREGGILGELEGQSVLVTILNKHPSSTVGIDELVQKRRAAGTETISKVLVCLTSPVSRTAREYAASGQPEMVLIERDELIRLAGAASPATNEQLLSLKQRRKKTPRLRTWAGQMLSENRAKGYFMYGLGMAALYLITGQLFYPVPAVICLCLCILTHMKAARARGSDRQRP